MVLLNIPRPAAVAVWAGSAMGAPDPGILPPPVFHWQNHGQRAAPTAFAAEAAAVVILDSAAEKLIAVGATGQGKRPGKHSAGEPVGTG